LDTSEEDDIEIYNNYHDSVDGISKPLDALEYQIQIHEIEKITVSMVTTNNKQNIG
jgi:hypothetical protein